MIDASRNHRRRHRSHVLTSLRISHDRGMSWPFAPSEDSSRDAPPSWPSPPLRLVAPVNRIYMACPPGEFSVMSRMQLMAKSALEQAGLVLVATRGIHRQFKHPHRPGRVTVAGRPSLCRCDRRNRSQFLCLCARFAGLVEHLSALAQREKAVAKAHRHPQLLLIVSAELRSHPLSLRPGPTKGVTSRGLQLPPCC